MVALAHPPVLCQEYRSIKLFKHTILIPFQYVNVELIFTYMYIAGWEIRKEIKLLPTCHHSITCVLCYAGMALIPLPLLLKFGNFSAQTCALYSLFRCFMVCISAVMVRLCVLAHRYFPP